MAGVDLPSWLPQGPSGPGSSNCGPVAAPKAAPSRRTIEQRLRIAEVVPGMSGSAVLFAHEFDGPLVGILLREREVAVAEVRLGPGEDLRSALPEIARALQLPDPASRNLDAFADAVADLAHWWPDDDAVALLLHGAHELVDADLPGWQTLTQILSQATERLAGYEAPARRWFETVALVDGHGVTSFAEHGAPE